jgi:hypothetical protein
MFTHHSALEFATSGNSTNKIVVISRSVLWHRCQEKVFYNALLMSIAL